MKWLELVIGAYLSYQSYQWAQRREEARKKSKDGYQ